MLVLTSFKELLRVHPPLCAIMAPKQLHFISGNENKLIEVKAILGDTVELQSQSLDLPELQGTIEEISSDKCKRAAHIVRFPDSLLKECR